LVEHRSRKAGVISSSLIAGSMEKRRSTAMNVVDLLSFSPHFPASWHQIGTKSEGMRESAPSKSFGRLRITRRHAGCLWAGGIAISSTRPSRANWLRRMRSRPPRLPSSGGTREEARQRGQAPRVVAQHQRYNALNCLTTSRLTARMLEKRGGSESNQSWIAQGRVTRWGMASPPGPGAALALYRQQEERR
jgi:hypothetical protein